MFACAIAPSELMRWRENGRTTVFVFYSLNYPEQGVLEMSSSELYYREEDGWGNYAKGVVVLLLRKAVR